MKTIENKKLEKASDVKNYASLALFICERPPLEGHTVATGRQAMKVCAILESQKEKESIELEDADFNFVKEQISKFKWGAYNTEIDDFVKSFEL